MLYRARQTGPTLKSNAELEKMRTAGRMASECLQWLVEHVEPGITTEDLHKLQMEYARKHGVVPAPLNYRGFPKSLCTSVNEVICHGIPSPTHVLEEGDIIGIDVTLIVDGFYGDNCTTVPVGEISADAQQLLETTLESLRLAIGEVAPNKRLGDIGHAIQSHVEPKGYSVVREFVGHGIGRQFHEPPQVCHYGRPGRGTRLRAGMTFTIEPMVNQGVYDCRILDDGWTALTADGKLSAQFEHTIAVTNNGVEILTVQNGEGAWEAPGRAFGFA